MKRSLFITLTMILAASVLPADAQRRPTGSSAARTGRSPEIGQSAVVIDETLSLLRKEPSLFSESVHRMQRGRKVQILGVAEADGVKFYKVAVPPTNFGWVQADAVFGKFRPADEARLVKFVQAIDGFDQIEAASHFFALYPTSQFRPSLLLLYGDLLEEAALKLSKDANSRLKAREMAATAAPMHSYYLNFNYLDRYRKLGIVFLFNAAARQFHYNGASWQEIVSKFPASPEAKDAQKRLETLQARMEKGPAK